MSVWIVVWVVLMMFWLFGGCFVAYENNAFNGRTFIGYSLIPFLCVLILGLLFFGAITPGAPVVR